MGNVAKQFDYDRAMLWGDRLRVLLNSDHISKGEISEALKEKGIFIGSSEKSDTIPILSSCLLTPSEFKRLIEKSFIRESGKKYSSCKFKLTSISSNWKSELLENFHTAIGGIQLDDGREFASEPAISAEKDGSIRISYALRVLDFSKDWIEQEIVYPSEICINQSENSLDIEVNRFRTSKDTNRLNDAITAAIGKFYKYKNITTEEKPKSIRFDDFTNNERIRFFLRLTAINNFEFSFKEIGNFEIIRDQYAGTLPKEQRIEWMEGRVNKIQIKGKDLGRIFLLEEPDYYQYYFPVKMTCIYAFKFGTNTGECSIDFSFSGKTSRDDDYSETTFDFSIERLTRLEETSKNRIRREIIQTIQTVCDSAFNHVKTSL